MKEACEYRDKNDYLEHYNKTEKEKLSLSQKRMCLFLFDKYLIPRYEEIIDIKDDSAVFLSSFLDRMGLTFDSFYKAILDEAIAGETDYGLDYLKEIGGAIGTRYSEEENDVEF